MDQNRLGYGQQGRPRGPGFMARVTGIAAALVGMVALVAFLVFGLMVSVVVLPVILILALVVIGYFWFKTRGIRKELKEQMQSYRESMPGSRPGEFGTGPRAPGADGKIIEGDDYIHEAGDRPEK